MTDSVGQLRKQLPARLASLLELIPIEGSVADIGTDHGLLPAALIMRGQNEKVIATDVRKQPLEAARRTLAEWKLEGKVDLRLGFGLRVLMPGEADYVVVAGISGRQTAELLLDSQSEPVIRSLRAIICQPAQQTALLRRNLRLAGWALIHETLVSERGKFYVNLMVRPAARLSKEAGEESKANFLSEALLDEIGPCLWHTRPPGYRPYLLKIAERYEKIARQARSGKDLSASSRKRLAELRQMSLELQRCLRELD